METKKFYIITDGACKVKLRLGGWAYCIVDVTNYQKVLDKKLKFDDAIVAVGGGKETDTTNNRMEMEACIRGCTAAVSICKLTKDKYNCHFTIITDSQHVRDSMTKWIFAWRLRNYKKVDGEPVKNYDKFEELYAVTRELRMLPSQWEWKPRNSNTLMTEVDRRAKEYSEQVASYACSILTERL